MSKPLAGKVALVTGGSRGIGRAIALRLASDGADVLISYTTSDVLAEGVVKKLKETGVRAAAFRADQGDAAQVATLVKRAADEFGRLDILVNNAGVLTLGQVTDSAADIESFERQYAINVRAVATAVRTAAPLLTDDGRIISIGSGLGSRAAFPGMSDYAATKAAVAAYTRGWAHDFAPRGITVNAVLPGPVDTDMNPEKGDFATAQLQAIPLRRFGRPEEIAAAVAFLAGPEAGFITGISLDVDGGFAA